MGESLLLTCENGIGTITFNRPEALNAINQEMADRFLAATETLGATPGLRLVILRGKGRGFMAGGDVSTFETDPDRIEAAFSALYRPIHGGLERLAALDAPVISVVHGIAAGAGLSIALAADIVLASHEAKFTTAYGKLGLSPDAGMSWVLPRLVGPRRALELILTAEMVGAEQALAEGMVSRLVAAGELEAALAGYVSVLGSGPTRAYGNMRRLVQASLHNDLPRQLRAEEAALLDSAATADARAGIAAFLEKRRPEFNGR